MANNQTIFPNQPHYKCNKCGYIKQASEFYVNKKRKSGLQAYCKTCCKESNTEFRIKRPTYYWGDENELGYLEKNYERFKEIIRKSNASDKTNKIYAIPTPDGTYIGATSRHLAVRKGDHKWQYIRWKNGLSKVKMPILYESLNKYSLEEVDKIFNSMYIIEEWSGNRQELLNREKEVIKEWIIQGKKVLNKRGTKIP